MDYAEEMGLNYFRSRFYIPAWGRFAIEDRGLLSMAMIVLYINPVGAMFDLAVFMSSEAERGK